MGIDMSASAPPRAAESGPRRRVLVVDDNRDVADSTALLLEAMGFEVRACYDGPTALQVAETFRPGVCFVDLNMPGMGGEELATRLRALAAVQPLVLAAVTAMSSEEYRQRSEAAGFDLYFVKPVNPFELVQVATNHFESQPAGAPSAACQPPRHSRV